MRAVTNPSFRQRIGYQAMLLGGFAMLAAAALVAGHVATREAIAERRAEDLRAALSRVVPAALHDNNLLEEVVTLPLAGGPKRVYRARLAGAITAVAMRMTGQGYAGPIEVILGIDRDGSLLGVRVLSHAETPGLGDKIEAQKSGWILGFDGLSLTNTPLADWAVKKDGGRFDQFSGATVTPRAVVAAVRAGLELLAAHRAELLAAPSEAGR